VAALSERSIPVTSGDAGERQILAAAGIKGAAAVVVAVPELDAVTRIIRTARSENPDVPILAAADSSEAAQRLQAAGATTLVQPAREAAASLTTQALAYLQPSAGQDGASGPRDGRSPAPDVLPEVQEVVLHADGALADCTLREARVRERFGVLVLDLRRADDPVLVNPSADTILRPGDRVRIFGLRRHLDAFREAAERADEPVQDCG
jgi:voltage-gated potassium channel